MCGCIRATILVPLVVLLSGCSEPSSTTGGYPPTTDPAIRGVVTRIHWLDQPTPAGTPVVGTREDPDTPIANTDPRSMAQQPDVLGSILVEEDPAQPYGSAKDSITLTIETRIFRQHGTDLQPATATELALGQTVRVWYTGPVAESYPRQARAGFVVIES